MPFHPQELEAFNLTVKTYWFLQKLFLRTIPNSPEQFGKHDFIH